jgi:hypothetical protein
VAEKIFEHDGKPKGSEFRRLQLSECFPFTVAAMSTWPYSTHVQREHGTINLPLKQGIIIDVTNRNWKVWKSNCASIYVMSNE